MRTAAMILLVSLAACASSATTETTLTSTTTTTTTAITTTLPTTTLPTTPTTATIPTPVTTASTVTTTTIATTPVGFTSVAATVTSADGEVCELCLWLAATPDQRARGLMSVTSLGGADGMAFVYPVPHTGSFWMRNTLMRLSIAFFAGDGTHLGEFDMEPCTSDPCLHYSTPTGFTIAIETTQGDLPQLGIGPGSVLDLTDLPCDPSADRTDGTG